MDRRVAGQWRTFEDPANQVGAAEPGQSQRRDESEREEPDWDIAVITRQVRSPRLLPIGRLDFVTAFDRIDPEGWPLLRRGRPGEAFVAHADPIRDHGTIPGGSSGQELNRDLTRPFFGGM